MPFVDARMPFASALAVESQNTDTLRRQTFIKDDLRKIKWMDYINELATTNLYMNKMQHYLKHIAWRSLIFKCRNEL
jgi:hypothetical protein